MTAGQFGTAADEVVRATGKTAYNIQLTIKNEGQVYKAYGVVSEDGKKMTFMDMVRVVGIGWMEWITEEEAAAIEAAKDPIEAPSHPYREFCFFESGRFCYETRCP